MHPLGEALFAIEKEAEEGRLEKEAEDASMARGWPMTPPEMREKRAQLVPNSNSMGMPVTTPKTKLMAKMRPQKRAARSHCSPPVLRAMVLRITISSRGPW